MDRWERVQTSLRIRNGKSWKHESEQGRGGLPEAAGRQADSPHPHSCGCSLPSPLSTPHPFRLCGGERPWPCRQAELRPPARQHCGVGRPAVVPAPTPTHLRLHVQLRATHGREAQWKRTGRRASRDPRSLARSRHRTRSSRDPALPARRHTRHF